MRIIWLLSEKIYVSIDSGPPRYPNGLHPILDQNLWFWWSQTLSPCLFVVWFRFTSPFLMYPYHILCWLNMIESYCIYRPFLLFLGNSRSNLDPIVDWYINTISPNIIPRQVFFLVHIFCRKKIAHHPRPNSPWIDPGLGIRERAAGEANRQTPWWKLSFWRALRYGFMIDYGSKAPMNDQWCFFFRNPIVVLGILG
jgi:hypothetical protein